jgi:hypothetical protein
MSQDRKPLALAELEVERAAEIASMVAELEGTIAPPAAFVASGKSQGKGAHGFAERFAASGKTVAGKNPSPRPGRFIASGKTPAKRQG